MPPDITISVQWYRYWIIL